MKQILITANASGFLAWQSVDRRGHGDIRGLAMNQAISRQNHYP